MSSSDEFLLTRDKSLLSNPALVPSKKKPMIVEMQERVDDIRTEAARLVVFANTTTDLALAASLKQIGKALFRSTTEIERRLAKLRRAQ